MSSPNPVFSTPEEQAKALADFIAKHAKPYDPATDDYDRPPFASDVQSPGRSAFYNLHYYLTKVPPESIVGLLLHYTSPGDVVVDPFSGSGMTGVACQMCARPDPQVHASFPDAKAGARVAVLNDLSPAACHITYNYTHPVDPSLMALEFQRIADKTAREIRQLYATNHFEVAVGIYDESVPEVAQHLDGCAHGESSLLPLPAISSDEQWELVSHSEVEQMLGYAPSQAMSTTNGSVPTTSANRKWIRMPASLVYVVWSDVYRCEGLKSIEEPTDRVNARTGNRVMVKRRVARGCRQEIIARGTDDKGEDDGNNAFLRCPHCNERWMKGRLQRVGLVPVEECYEYVGLAMVRGQLQPKRFRVIRPVSAQQRRLIDELNKQPIPYWYPAFAVNKEGPRYRRDSLAGKRIHTYPDFFTHRNLWALSLLWKHIGEADTRVRDALRFCFTSQIMRCSRLRRMKGSKPGEQLSGTLHIASETAETNVFRVVAKAVTDYARAVAGVSVSVTDQSFVQLGSATHLEGIPDGSVDYVFTDPPFGSNIYYSDVAYMWEAWFSRFTDEPQEAIMHRPVDGGYKRLEHYASLMDHAFAEISRILRAYPNNP